MHSDVLCDLRVGRSRPCRAVGVVQNSTSFKQVKALKHIALCIEIQGWAFAGATIHAQCSELTAVPLGLAGNAPGRCRPSDMDGVLSEMKSCARKPRLSKVLWLKPRKS